MQAAEPQAGATRLIRHGPNAGRPQSLNERLLDRVTAAKQAVIALRQEGYTVLRVDVEHGARTTITIEPCERCAELIERGEAVYYKWVAVHGVRETWGHFQREDCRVLWREEGTR